MYIAGNATDAVLTPGAVVGDEGAHGVVATILMLGRYARQQLLTTTRNACRAAAQTGGHGAARGSHGVSETHE